MIDRMSEQIVSTMIETMPLEITVIDAHDEVIGWNKHETRLFKRPLTSMGLNFRQCHPEKSLSKVEQIITEMKEGKRDKARFWIDLTMETTKKKHKVLIEFYALRDYSGNYIGCMECTQDIEDIRLLESEKRLLG